MRVQGRYLHRAVDARYGLVFHSLAKEGIALVRPHLLRFIELYRLVNEYYRFSIFPKGHQCFSLEMVYPRVLHIASDGAIAPMQ